MYIVIALLIFGVLIAVHELGHFLCAKACNVRVLEFSLGMGPPLFKKQRGETLYAVRALPIGGYCAMEGEDSESDDPRAFTRQPRWKRLLILCAGSAMNFFLGFLLVLLVFAGADYFTTPVITGFMEGCPYEGENALMEGDTFYRIDGHRIYFTSNIITYMSRSGGDTHDIVVIRDGKKVALDRFHMPLREYTRPDGTSELKYGLYFGIKENSFGAHLRYSWYGTVDFVREAWMGLTDLITGSIGVKALSGPVGIVSMINQVGESSASPVDAFENIAYFTALITVNLAVINMLPFPALDGGRVFGVIVLGVAERISRRRLNPKYEGYVHAAGLALLLAFMAYVMYNDIARIL